jgi:hypothetical protein
VRKSALLPLSGPEKPGLYQYESSGYAAASSSYCMSANSNMLLRISPGRTLKSGLWGWKLEGSEIGLDIIVRAAQGYRSGFIVDKSRLKDMMSLCTAVWSL